MFDSIVLASIVILVRFHSNGGVASLCNRIFCMIIFSQDECFNVIKCRRKENVEMSHFTLIVELKFQPACVQWKSYKAENLDPLR